MRMVGPRPLRYGAKPDNANNKRYRLFSQQGILTACSISRLHVRLGPVSDGPAQEGAPNTCLVVPLTLARCCRGCRKVCTLLSSSGNATACCDHTIVCAIRALGRYRGIDAHARLCASLVYVLFQSLLAWPGTRLRSRGSIPPRTVPETYQRQPGQPTGPPRPAGYIV